MRLSQVKKEWLSLRKNYMKLERTLISVSGEAIVEQNARWKLIKDTDILGIKKV